MPNKKNKLSLHNLANVNYVKKLFKNNLSSDHDIFTKPNKLYIRPIKQHFDKIFEHSVILYSFHFKADDKYHLYCSAHSDGSRKKIFTILKISYKKQITSQKPLFYDNDTQALFYEGVRGDNLFSHIEQGHEIKNFIKQSAIKLAHLHQLKPPKTLKKFTISKKILDSAGILNKNNTILIEQRKTIIKLFKIIKQEFNNLKINSQQKYFVHGDFHPENIIISQTGEINLIDFTDAVISDYCQDLGSFLQQLGYMTGNQYSKRQIDNYQKLFISSYFNIRKIKYNQNIENKINLFQAWNALRSSFLLSSYNRKKDTIRLIKQTEKFLKFYDK